MGTHTYTPLEISQTMSSVVKLGYWKIRGLLAPCEMLCEFVDQPYETTKYEVFEKPDGTGWDQSSWLNVKYTLGITMPNLPYLIDDDANVKISESWAVLKYIARKNGQCIPANNADLALAENLEGFLSDFRMGFIRVCYMGADRAQWMEAGVNKFLKVFEELLDGKDWFLGGIRGREQPSYVDFFAWEIIYHHCCMDSTFLEKYPNLKNWHEKF